MRNGPGDGLAMTLDREGQPVILWTDDNGSYFSDDEAPNSVDEQTTQHEGERDHLGGQ
jgi:hypothetical protein